MLRKLDLLGRSGDEGTSRIPFDAFRQGAEVSGSGAQVFDGRADIVLIAGNHSIQALGGVTEILEQPGQITPLSHLAYPTGDNRRIVQSLFQRYIGQEAVHSEERVVGCLECDLQL